MFKNLKKLNYIAIKLELGFDEVVKIKEKICTSLSDGNDPNQLVIDVLFLLAD
jgi:hypothetical protein